MTKKQFNKLQKLLKEYLYSKCDSKNYLKDDFTCGIKTVKFEYSNFTPEKIENIDKYVMKVSQTDIEDVIKTLPETQRAVLDDVLNGLSAKQIKEQKGNNAVMTTYKTLMGKFVDLVVKYKEAENPDSIYNYTDIHTAQYLYRRGYKRYSLIEKRYTKNGIKGLRNMKGIGDKYLTEKIIPMLESQGIKIDTEELEPKRKFISVDLAVDLLLENKEEVAKFDKDTLTEILSKYQLKEKAIK